MNDSSTSPAQLTANRTNALKSTGPKTQRGKCPNKDTIADSLTQHKKKAHSGANYFAPGAHYYRW